MNIKAKIHSFQSLGTVDGPSVRFVVFFQGCNLRCKCCHNPDTWALNSGTEYTAREIVDRAERYREYFGDKGGITLSGGEPLLQAAAAEEIFKLCAEKGINTCLDTSGSILNADVRALLARTDRVLLDVKYTADSLYSENVGCSFGRVMAFLDYLEEIQLPTVLRQVIIPTVNDTPESVTELGKIAEKYNCVEKIELLPFRKICQSKYDSMNIKFPFGDLPEADAEKINTLKSFLSK